MRKISSGGGVDITGMEAANKVQINPGLPLSVTNITLRVPDNGSFKLSTVNAGDIQVDQISGEFEVTNVNGRIFLHKVSGSTVANTTNGEINATFNQVTPNAPMAFSTLNGSIFIRKIQ